MNRENKRKQYEKGYYKTHGCSDSFVCKVCGYIYEGDVLPDDFICPLCKHGAADFEPIS